MGDRIKNWRVDYGDGESHEISVPHAWRLDVDVRFEGPVVYSTSFQVPRELSVLRFDGVSYEAVVSIDGEAVATHRGIWDAFEIPLTAWAGRKVEVSVAVTKNGGERFPVKDVASGFLPYVYHSFGGIWGLVEVRVAGGGREASSLESDFTPHAPRLTPRVSVDGSLIYVDNEPFYVRGLLHWGWYPELGHHNAPEETIRREVREAKKLGFNLVKFCLWVPPHKYLEILEEEGMQAWLELPLWDPSSDLARLAEISEEIERIVRQYRHHDNIIIWTVGCELSHATPAEYRSYLVDLVRNLTGSPLVKDNSGGAEMYGGDLREFGDFYDYHPYCDTPFYPLVLDSLLPGARGKEPILLGEFNDADVHRDLVKVHEEMPYWASAMPEMNAKGVRWQYDLPGLLATNPLATGDEYERHQRLMSSTRSKALFMRKTVHEWVRARDPISGYVITGWRDTPISSAGFFDDWDRPRFSPEECLGWNGPDVLFLLPTRRPPWVDGGNRPGWLDSYNHFTGQVFFKVGIHSESGLEGGLVWRILDTDGSTVARGAEGRLFAGPLEAFQVGQISWDCQIPGSYELQAEFAGATNSWRFYVESKPEFKGWALEDPRYKLGTKAFGTGSNRVFFHIAELRGDEDRAVAILDGVGTKPVPFWREAGYEFLRGAPFAEEWERLLAVSGDRALDMEILAAILPKEAKYEILINRVDVRTYHEAPVMVRATWGGVKAVLTTLRPHGGLGVQPSGLDRNPAGCALMTKMMELTS
ncbi:MAG: hypothetical protein H7Y17_01775 [Chlorobia bacterium]|nr:hypothetical protein [Fimbriimonadaceae bacterium]